MVACGGSILSPPKVPPPPNDIALVCKEYRLYPTTDGSLRMSMKKENTHLPSYYRACILQRNSQFEKSDIQEEDRVRFLPWHKELLKAMFGIGFSLKKEGRTFRDSYFRCASVGLHIMNYGGTVHLTDSHYYVFNVSVPFALLFLMFVVLC